MALALLDTSVLIDFLRDFADAREWLRGIEGQLGVTRFVWMEVLEGALSRESQRQAIILLNRFELVPVSHEDLEWSIDALARLVPIYNGLSMKDVLIASSSSRLALPLYTRNLKHFQPLLGELARRPY